MEPRPYGRGDRLLALMQRWEGGFNGATAIRPWRRRMHDGDNDCAALLQWSHGHTAVETVRQPSGVSSMRSASMEPRPYGRGDTYLASSRRWDGSLQWSHGHTAVETLWHWSPIRHITRASMEPRPYGRGDIASGRRWPSKRQRFNGATAIRPWRPPRAHAAVECGCRASMEPRPYGRGDDPSGGEVVVLRAASMEPRPYGR